MHIEFHRGDRSALAPLFALADDSPSQIELYLALGEVLVAREGDAILGHLQIIETDEESVFEIKSMAVVETSRGQAIGRRLVAAAVDACKARHGRRLIVSTAAADVGNLRFYQRQGFRLLRIVRDAFGPSNGYPVDTTIGGILLRDQVVLDLDL